MERERGRRLSTAILIVLAVVALLAGLVVWALVRSLSDPVQTQASNEVLDTIEPADLEEVGRSSEGNAGSTLIRTYELGNLDPRDVVVPPDGFEARDGADVVDDGDWDGVASWAGPSPKGEGDCVIWAAISRPKDVRPRLLRLTVSCLALEVPGV